MSVALARTIKRVRLTTEYAALLPWARDVPYTEPGCSGDLATVVARFQPVRDAGKLLVVMRRDFPGDDWREVGTDRTVTEVLEGAR